MKWTCFVVVLCWPIMNIMFLTTVSLTPYMLSNNVQNFLLCILFRSLWIKVWKCSKIEMRWDHKVDHQGNENEVDYKSLEKSKFSNFALFPPDMARFHDLLLVSICLDCLKTSSILELFMKFLLWVIN